MGVPRKVLTGKQLRKPIRITDSILARAYAGGSNHPPLDRLVGKEQVFRIAMPPPGVVPEGHQMAMDSSIAWASNSLVGAGYGGYGWCGFIGYPELAYLSQIVEYRRISEVIATECTRKGIEFESASKKKKKEDKITELKDAIKRIRLMDHIANLVLNDGFFGRSHLYIDTGQTDDREELTKDIGDGRNKISRAKLSKGCLKALRVIEPIWTYPTTYNSNDPLKPSWYSPDQWFVMSKQVHRSRLIPFIGRPVADLLKPAYSFGGLSLTQLCIPYVNNWLQTRQSVNNIIQAFTSFVLATNLSASLSADGDQLFKRAILFNLIRTNRDLLMIDKDSEEFQNVSVPLGTLDQLQAQAQEHMSAASGIPLVKLLGIQPAGLNATSEGEIRTFYDNIGAFQEKVIRPVLTTVLDIIQISIWGAVDEDLTFVFNPLWSLDEKAEAEKKKTEADTHAVYVDAGIVDQQEVREVLANEPGSAYASLDPDKVPELPLDVMGKPVDARKMLGNEDDPKEPAPGEPKGGGQKRKQPKQPDA